MRHVLARLRQRLSARRPYDRTVASLAAGCGPQFESLEPRNLLSGNVTATVVGGTLIVIGDAESNRLEVTDGGGGAISLDAAGDDLTPTTINGAAGPSVFGGVTNILFKLKGGNDEVAFDTVAITGNVTVIDNQGVDAVYLTDTTVGGNVLLKTGKDSDLILLSGTTAITGNLTIITGGGNDAVQFHTAAGGDGPVTVAGRTKIITGGGADTVYYFEEAGASFAQFLLNTGGGDDFVELNGFVSTAGPRILTGSGADMLSIIGGEFTEDTRVNTGGGDDTLEVMNSLFGSNAFFTLGGGDDAATFTGVVSYERFNVSAGNGDDTMEVVFEDADMTQQALTFSSRFHGGPGDDELTLEDADIFVTQPVIIAIEVVS